MNILTQNAPLAERISQVAEVAGLLWQKGWAERNGGNIVVNLAGCADALLHSLPALSEPRPIGTEVPHLRGAYFYCKGTNRRMRDLARDPMANGCILRITDDCAHYEIVADQPLPPTSELTSHLLMHDYFVGHGSPYRATLHTHPIELVALTHHRPFLEKDVLTRLLWSMIPETKAFCPRGVGIVPYMLPSSVQLAQATLSAIDSGYDVVLWEKHGVFAADTDIMAAFDQVDVLNKSAQIYLSARAMGFDPEGMTDHQMQEMTKAFNLPK